MFSMCSELTPRAPIPDTRIPQLMQPCAYPNHSLESDEILKILSNLFRSLSSSEFQVLTGNLTQNKKENLNDIFELPTKTLLGWSSYT